MCLIIAPGKDGKKALLPRDVFNYVYGKNDDGFGAMWTEDGKVNHFKTLGMTADEIYGSMEEYTERYPDVVFHMRYRTHGKVTPGLCHPFRILHRSRHGKDMFFMHNGVLSNFGNDLKPGQSDTTNFKDKILVPLLTRNADALSDKETLDAINRLTSGSRLLFMDSTGKVTRTSESSWNERYGLTLSNTYMLPTEQYKAPTQQVPSTYRATGAAVYNTYRSIKYVDGTVKGQWCSIPKTGFVRTETGALYIDQGSQTPIDHEKWIIRKENEEVALASFQRIGSPAEESAKTLLTLVNDDTPFPSEESIIETTAVDLEDDDLPWDDEDEDTYTVAAGHGTTVGDAVASRDEQLRYARLVHNTHLGRVISRRQMVADVMCSGTEELYELVKADPETSHAILAELFEIFIEQNDILARDASTEVYSFDPDEMLERGTIGYHRQGMQDITELRRKSYEQMVKDRAEAAFTKSYPEDTGSEAMEKVA